MRIRPSSSPLKHCTLTIFSLLIVLHMTTTVLFACEWDYLIWIPRSKSADPLYRFIKDGKAGYIDRSGKVVIEPKFEPRGNYGGEFHDGLMAVGLYEGPFVGASGKVVIDRGYYRAWDFSEGLAVAMQENYGKWGYIDRSSEFVISPRFDSSPNNYVSSFSGGLAIIQVKQRYGYIDRTGEFVIRPKFLQATSFQEGLARVVVEGPCMYFGPSPCPDYRQLGDPSQQEVPPCKYTFIDKTGSIITGERFENAKDFSEGLAPVRKEGRWGFIDEHGEFVIAPQFDDAEPFSEGLARVKQDKQWGYIDKSGKMVIKAEFKYAESFSEGPGGERKSR